MTAASLELSLGPVSFYWTRERYFAFYEQACHWPLTSVTLGETVCSRRRDMKLADWLEIGHQLAAAGKQVILGSQTLIESNADLRDLTRLCDNGDFLVEANDMSAVHRLSEAGLPFVGGPALNLYNVPTLEILKRAGMFRFVAPVELPGADLARLLSDAREAGLALDCEVLAYGHLPLAWSSRCFTARHHQHPKDRCQFVCQDYPEGLSLTTQDDSRRLFTLNGIQTLSGACQDLRHELAEMAAMGVSAARLSPRSEGMDEVVADFDLARQGRYPAPSPLALVDAELCNGYWHGQAGMDLAPVLED
ncbi:U32 family peptidase [Halomonas litopenaei]|nr:U32 family peptidase [Halomonas litopenaei]